jgi:hypothetical protein
LDRDGITRGSRERRGDITEDIGDLRASRKNGKGGSSRSVNRHGPSLSNSRCAHVLDRASSRARCVLVRAKQPRAKVGSETHNKILKSKLAVS